MTLDFCFLECSRSMYMPPLSTRTLRCVPHQGRPRKYSIPLGTRRDPIRKQSFWEVAGGIWAVFLRLCGLCWDRGQPYPASVLQACGYYSSDLTVSPWAGKSSLTLFRMFSHCLRATRLYELRGAFSRLQFPHLWGRGASIAHPASVCVASFTRCASWSSNLLYR